MGKKGLLWCLQSEYIYSEHILYLFLIKQKDQICVCKYAQSNVSYILMYFKCVKYVGILEVLYSISNQFCIMKPVYQNTGCPKIPVTVLNLRLKSSIAR